MRDHEEAAPPLRGGQERLEHDGHERGGHTDVALRRTGELADAWHPIAMRPPAMLLPGEYEEAMVYLLAQRLAPSTARA